MKTYVIGAGGVGSHLLPSLCLLIGPEEVVVIDGDILEKHNLNRQLFQDTDIGRKKAEALAQRYGCEAIPKWYSFGMMEQQKTDILICCCDNNPARVAVLNACDFEGCSAVIAANETLSSEAYVYQPEWRGTNLDPRVSDPEMVNDRTGDPRAAAIGCTGEAQERNRQLVSANMMAAALALHLYVVHFIESRKLDSETLQHLPSKLIQNMTRSESFKSIITTTQQTTMEERTANE